MLAKGKSKISKQIYSFNFLQHQQILKMVQKSKEEICDFLNKFYIEFKDPSEGTSSDKIKIRVPIFQKKHKRLVLKILTLLFRKRVFNSLYDSRKISGIDFSKYIEPDEWKIYEEEKNKFQRKAIPKFCIENKNCWEIDLMPEFCKENLEYGVRPITILDSITLIGNGPIIWGKKSNKFYETGSGNWFYHNLSDEYDKYIKGLKSKIQWNLLEIKINDK